MIDFVQQETSVFRKLPERADGVTIRAVGNIARIMRIPRDIKQIIEEILLSPTSGDIDKILSLLGDEERALLLDHLRTSPDTKSSLKDLLGKLASSVEGRRFLRAEGGKQLEKECIVIMIILWLTDNGFYIENYLGSTEYTSLTEIVYMGKSRQLTLEDFASVNHKYWSNALSTEGNFKNWIHLCNGTHDAL